MALFRREAMAGRGQALEGAVSLAVPLSWQIVGGLLFASVAGAASFLALATTDRVVTLEASVTDTAIAILPVADAAMLPPGSCGALVLQGQRDSRAAWIGERGTAASHALSDGTVVDAHGVTLRLASPAPPGARGTVRFVTGRESLWASLTR